MTDLWTAGAAERQREVNHAHMMALVNQERQKHGVSEVFRSAHLIETAERKAHDMVQRGYFGHLDPDGVGVASAENIAKGYGSIRRVFEGWRNSPGHHANIINPRWHWFGYGAYEDHWVQHFSP